MDPNANVAEQWSIVRDARRAGTVAHADTLRLTELREALRDWRASGAFAPDRAAPTLGDCRSVFARSK